MIPLTDEENESYKKYNKVRDHCHCKGKYRGAAYSICNLRYKTLKEIPVVFHKCSTYDYHFIIKEIAKKIGGSISMLRRKYIEIYYFFSTN